MSRRAPSSTRRSRTFVAAALLTIATLLTQSASHAEREFRVYMSLEAQADVDLPPDYQVPGEFVVGRLMYPNSYGFRRFGFGGDWHQGGTAWAVDYPRADRTFARLLRRLTRINVRSVEQPINLDDGDDVYDWPFLMVGLPGMWDLTDDQVTKLREYLLRGGFLLCDSFFGSQEWDGFMTGMRRVFPDRPIVELPADHPIFHIVYDLTERPQIPTWQHLPRGYRNDGAVPHWRAILDDDGRVMVMITYNNDIADGWQRADSYRYPPEAAYLALALGVNFAVYALTH